MSVVEHKHSTKQYSIALPCEPAHFGEFISSLLGKPQTISGTRRGAFEIKREDIINSHQLITQRVMQQNDAQLIQFIVKLVFDDNSSVLLNSFNDFLAYTEVRPVSVMQIHLSWSFLVQFRDRDHPEKQEIDLSFLTAARGTIALDESSDSSFVPVSRLISGGFVAFSIRHTARTWGADIENLLAGHVEHLILPQSPARAFAEKHSGKIATAVALLFFIGTIAVCFISANRLAANQLQKLATLLQKHDAFDLKLNQLLQLAADGFWGKYFFSVFVFSIFSFVFSILLGYWAGSTADTQKPSYILLTKKSEQIKIERDKKYKIQWISFLCSIFVGIATGVIANILFAKYWGS